MNLCSWNWELILPSFLFLVSIIVSGWLVPKRTTKMNNEQFKKQRRYDFASRNQDIYKKINESVIHVQTSFFRLLNSGAPLSYIIDETEASLVKEVRESMNLKRIATEIKDEKGVLDDVFRHRLNHTLGRKRLQDCYTHMKSFRIEFEKNKILFTPELVQTLSSFKYSYNQIIVDFKEYLKEAENWNGLSWNTIELYKSREFWNFAKQSLDQITNQSHFIDKEFRKLLLVP